MSTAQIIVGVLWVTALATTVIGEGLRDRKRKNLFFIIATIFLIAAWGGTIYLSFLPDF